MHRPCCLLSAPRCCRCNPSTVYYEDIAWLKQHHLPTGCREDLSKIYGSGLALRSALTRNPYAPIGSVKGYMLSHAEAAAAALKCDPGAPERAAAVLLQELQRACMKDSVCGLPWQQLQQCGYERLEKLGRDYGRPWPVGQSLRPGAEQLLQARKVVAEEMIILPVQQGGGSSSANQQVQQPLHDFKCVCRDWSDDAMMTPAKLYAAESDFVAFILQLTARCAVIIEMLQKATASSNSSSSETGSRDSSNTSGSRCRRKKPSTRSSSSSSSTSSNSFLFDSDSQDVISSDVSDIEAEMSLALNRQVRFNAGQRLALAISTSLPVLVLTGGPGCGKTLTAQAVVRLWLQETSEDDIAMMAPTGEA
jgi:hypothetical protein